MVAGSPYLRIEPNDPDDETADIRMIAKRDDDDDRDPCKCQYIGCNVFKPDVMVARRPYGEETIYWYCPEHDPLESEYADNWVEA